MPRYQGTIFEHNHKDPISAAAEKQREEQKNREYWDNYAKTHPHACPNPPGKCR